MNIIILYYLYNFTISGKVSYKFFHRSLRREISKTAKQFNLRWFTPKIEIKLCGHATLAAAHAAFHCYGNKSEVLDFMTKSGKLSVTKSQNHQNCLSMDFPSNPPIPVDRGQYKKMLEACIPDEAWIEDVQLSPYLEYLLVRLKDCITRDQLQSISPRYSLMLDALPSGLIGVGVTLIGTDKNQCVDSSGQVYDFVSRFFAPWSGVPEDPVTGSWHTCAGAYWAKQLNKTQMYAHQCSPRGGNVWIEIKDDRAILSGQAVAVLQGTFNL